MSHKEGKNNLYVSNTLHKYLKQNKIVIMPCFKFACIIYLFYFTGIQA